MMGVNDNGLSLRKTRTELKETTKGTGELTAFFTRVDLLLT